MTPQFIHSFQSEWLKRKRSLSSWLVICGAFFTPSIILVIRLVHNETLSRATVSPGYWKNHWTTSWESVAVFLLPLGAILASSLITQLEYRDNTWKLLHTSPQPFAIIFFAKLSVILLMMLQFLVLFNIGIYLSGILPALLSGLPYPSAPIPYRSLLIEDARFLLASLPIIACQYLISLQFKNFLVPLGVGIALWILSVGMASWKYGWLIPYSYTLFNHVRNRPKFMNDAPLMTMASGYFLLFTVIAYLLYINKKEKG